MEINLSLTPTIDLIEAIWVTWFLVVCAGASYNLRSAWQYFVAAMYDASPTVRFYGGGGFFVAFFLLAASVCGLVAGLVTMFVPSSIQDIGTAATTQVLVALASRTVLILLGFNLGAAVLADAWIRHTIIRLAMADPSLPNKDIVAAIAEVGEKADAAYQAANHTNIAIKRLGLGLKDVQEDQARSEGGTGGASAPAIEVGSEGGR